MTVSLSVGTVLLSMYSGCSLRCLLLWATAWLDLFLKERQKVGEHVSCISISMRAFEGTPDYIGRIARDYFPALYFKKENTPTVDICEI